MPWAWRTQIGRLATPDRPRSASSAGNALRVMRLSQIAAELADPSTRARTSSSARSPAAAELADVDQSEDLELGDVAAAYRCASSLIVTLLPPCAVSSRSASRYASARVANSSADGESSGAAAGTARATAAGSQARALAIAR